jgi:hypothetical protein
MIIIEVIIEALFAAFYSLFIMIILKPFISTQILWFCIGFSKHFIGYFIGLHTYYCKFGSACKNHTGITADSTYIIPHSILEGLAFAYIGYFAKEYNPYLSITIAGFLIHILAELSGLHKYFCSHMCKINVFI